MYMTGSNTIIYYNGTAFRDWQQRSRKKEGRKEERKSLAEYMCVGG